MVRLDGRLGLIAATVVVLNNLAGIAVDFFYLMLSPIFANSAEIAGLAGNPFIKVGTCLVFILIATWTSYRDMPTIQKVQYWLVGFQLIVQSRVCPAFFRGETLSLAAPRFGEWEE